MIKIIAILMFVAGLYLVTYWAKDNLRKKQLLWFGIGLVICSILVTSVVGFKKHKYKMMNPSEQVEDSEIIKMKELLSIE
jgi:phosphoglycerol transferase MdoB-like AlkP superfamily enzyme